MRPIVAGRVQAVQELRRVSGIDAGVERFVERPERCGVVHQVDL